MKYIYLLRAGGDTYKLGITLNIKNRIKEIQTSNATQIELMMTAPVADARGVEASLHQWLGEHRLNGGSEWFKLEPEMTLELISRVTRASSSELLKEITIRNLLHRQEVVEKKISQIYERVDKRIQAIVPKSPPLRKEDELFEEAVNHVIEAGVCSASFLQRKMRIGYARAARLVDQLEGAGVVGPLKGLSRREVKKDKNSIQKVPQMMSRTQ